MWLSYLILAATDLLLLAVALFFGLMLGNHAPGAELAEPRYTQHVLLGITAVLFTSFVQVIGFTYFVVHTRMAADGVAAGALSAAGHAEIVGAKRRALRFLLLGVGSILITAASGALVSGRPVFSANWHMAAGMAALAGNAIAFARQLVLIKQNAARVEILYGPSASAR